MFSRLKKPEGFRTDATLAALALVAMMATGCRSVREPHPQMPPGIYEVGPSGQLRRLGDAAPAGVGVGVKPAPYFPPAPPAVETIPPTELPLPMPRKERTEGELVPKQPRLLGEPVAIKPFIPATLPPIGSGVMDDPVIPSGVVTGVRPASKPLGEPPPEPKPAPLPPTVKVEREEAKPPTAPAPFGIPKLPPPTK